MTEIMQELTAIKKINEAMSKQVLTFTRIAQAKRTQKVLIEATKESKTH